MNYIIKNRQYIYMKTQILALIDLNLIIDQLISIKVKQNY